MVSLARRRLVLTSVAPKRAAAVALLFALTACGGGGGTSGVSPSTPISLAPSAAPVPGASTAPDSSPAPASPAPPVSPAPTSPAPGAPGAVIAVPAALSFDGIAAAAQSVALRQTANAGGFVLSSQNCGGIASVSPVRGPGPFVFTPVAAGTCSYMATGSGGATAAIAIVVTTTTITPK